MAYLAKHTPGSGGGFTWTKADQVIEVDDEALARELILAAHGDIYQVNEMPDDKSKAFSEVVAPEDVKSESDKAPARGRTKASDK